MSILSMIGLYLSSAFLSFIVNALYDGFFGSTEKDMKESIIISLIPIVNTVAALSIGIFLFFFIGIWFLRNKFLKEDSFLIKVYKNLGNLAPQKDQK